jgi:type 1 glutamine amidotransferase/HEAT repeat protein
MKHIFFATLLCVAGANAAPLPADIVTALQAVQTYDYGQPRQPLFTVEAYAGRASAQPEQRQVLAAAFARMLAAPEATAAARAFACKELALVGGEAEVPVLAALLDKPELSDDARNALQAMPSSAASIALRSALTQLKGKPLVGVIYTLGARRDTEAIGALTRLLNNTDTQVVAATTWTLGRIGTPEAVAALPKDAMEARLLCAEHSGGPTAQAFYMELCAAPQPTTRLAGLAGLARLDPQGSLAELLKAAHDADTALGSGALQLAGRMPGDGVTAALVAELPKFAAARQVALLEILAGRHATAARGAVAVLAGSQDEAVRAAALTTLGSLGDATYVPLLLQAAADKKSVTHAAAESALTQMAAPGLDEAFIQAIATGAPGARVAAINAAAGRAQTSALPALCAALRDGDNTVRAAAAKAVGKVGTAENYPQLVALLGEMQSADLESAVAAVGRRLPDAQARLAPLLALLQHQGTGMATQAAVLRTLAGIGGDEALAAVRERLTSKDATLQDAAVRALGDWPDGAALKDLRKLVSTSSNSVYKALALRGLFRLAPTVNEGACWFGGEVLDAMKTADEKRQWLGALGTVHNFDAWDVASALLNDSEVKKEAALAMAQIGKALIPVAPDRVLEEMELILKTVPTSIEAQAVRAEAQQELGIKSAYSDARRKALATGLPAGAQIAAYLDCGVEKQDKSAAGVTLRVTHGGNWAWHGEAANPAALTITFGSGHINFEASGLQAQKHYQLGFTWWDYDANGREQSVWIGGTKVLDKTALPVWRGKQQAPTQIAVTIPADAIKNGKVAIEFRGEGAGNVVCSELWLVESATQFATVTATITVVPAPPLAARVTKPEVRANAGAQKKILIVTGCDLHNWRATTPVLTAALAKDKRLEISVVEDANFLAAPELKNYDVLVLHYQNHQVAAPGPAALANFRQFVEDGRGLVIVHFACGAFIDWTTKTVSKDFLPIAGRVWDPKLRAHDPRGPFHVQVVDHTHPITAGMSDFDTTDELYTCLSGDVPIQVLATATSKVDKKVYPMAFVFHPGKGRVFHSPLGHDVQAFNDAVGTLFRRGAAWAAGLPPGE